MTILLQLSEEKLPKFCTEQILFSNLYVGECVVWDELCGCQVRFTGVILIQGCNEKIILFKMMKQRNDSLAGNASQYKKTW